MRYLYTFLFCCAVPFFLHAQEMVLNPSFNMISCPTGPDQFNATRVAQWDNATLANPDYFNVCNNTNVSTPYNFAGYQPGNDYAGIVCYQDFSNYREYIKGNITPLIVDSYYRVELSINLANGCKYASDGLGVYFYKNGVPVNLNTSDFLPLTPQVMFHHNYLTTDTLYWYSVSGTMFADSAYDKIIIGDFKSNAVIDTLLWNPSDTALKSAYYLIGNVSITPIYHQAYCPTTWTPPCYGDSNGTASVGICNGQAPYTYYWLPNGETTASINHLSAGTYTCIIGDAAGDTTIQTVTIVGPSSPLGITLLSKRDACWGTASGIASVTGTGGAGSYGYYWNPSGQTSHTAENLWPATFTVTVTDGGGCQHDTTIVINELPKLEATNTLVMPLCFGQSNGSATVNMTVGTPPYSYYWVPGGGIGQTANNLIAGSYTCVITDANTCELIDPMVLGTPTVLMATTSQVNIGCLTLTGTATVNVSGGTPGYTYSWAPSGGNGPTASGLAAGNYTCTVKDANNCSLSRIFTILNANTLSVTNTHSDVNCYGAATGTATVNVTGGTTPYTYQWLPTGGNNAVATGLTAGTYTCNINDNDGCSASTQVTLIEPASAVTATTTQTNILCHGAATGSAGVSVSGGTAPYTYAWTPSGANTPGITNKVAGSYTCTIKDAKLCVLEKIIDITEPPALALTLSYTNVKCRGANDGTANVVASGGVAPYTYNWTPTGGTQANASNLAPGAYTCVVTDANGCTAQTYMTVSEPSTLLTVSDTHIDVLCHGAATGSATISVSGGSPTYVYSWTPAAGVGATVNNMPAGTYTCSVTDQNDCVIAHILTIAEPATAMNVQSTHTETRCVGANDGTATVNVSGGTGPYTYSWLPADETGPHIEHLSAGTYTCKIVDANGCVQAATFVITDSPNVFRYTITDSAIDCKSSMVMATKDDGSFTAQYIGWLFNGSISSGNPMLCTFPQSGTYPVKLIISSAEGCRDTISYSLNVHNLIVANFIYGPAHPVPGVPIHFFNQSSASAIKFRWDFGDQTSSDERNPYKTYNDAGINTVCLEVSDANDCKAMVCQEVNPETEKIVGIPTAFSPNGDGENDMLYVRGYRIAKMRLRIYNRWGNMVFESDRTSVGWDGTYKGQPQVAESYGYTLDVTYNDNSTERKEGNVQLLR